MKSVLFTRLIIVVNFIIVPRFVSVRGFVSQLNRHIFPLFFVVVWKVHCLQKLSNFWCQYNNIFLLSFMHVRCPVSELHDCTCPIQMYGVKLFAGMWNIYKKFSIYPACHWTLSLPIPSFVHWCTTVSEIHKLNKRTK